MTTVQQVYEVMQRLAPPELAEHWDNPGLLVDCGGEVRRVLVTLGYASWSEGQLEAELADNSWLTVAANTDLIFDTPVAERYDSALGLLGLEAWRLAPQAGHA